MDKIVLIIGDKRWVGPADFFDESYFIENGNLRIVFTSPGLRLQQICLGFTPVTQLHNGDIHYNIYEITGIKNPKHIQSFEDILECNTLWKKRCFILEKNNNPSVQKQKTD